MNSRFMLRSASSMAGAEKTLKGSRDSEERAYLMSRAFAQDVTSHFSKAKRIALAERNDRNGAASANDEEAK